MSTGKREPDEWHGLVDTCRHTQGLYVEQAAGFFEYTDVHVVMWWPSRALGGMHCGLSGPASADITIWPKHERIVIITALSRDVA